MEPPLILMWEPCSRGGEFYKLNPLLIAAKACLTFELFNDAIWFIQRAQVRKNRIGFMLKHLKDVITEKTEVSSLSCSKGGIRLRHHQAHQDLWDPCPPFWYQNIL